MTQIFSYGTQWANGFVCWISWEFLFMHILFITFQLEIVVVDMLLAAPSSYLTE